MAIKTFLLLLFVTVWVDPSWQCTNPRDARCRGEVNTARPTTIQTVPNSEDESARGINYLSGTVPPGAKPWSIFRIFPTWLLKPKRGDNQDKYGAAGNTNTHNYDQYQALAASRPVTSPTPSEKNPISQATTSRKTSTSSATKARADSNSKNSDKNKKKKKKSATSASDEDSEEEEDEEDEEEEEEEEEEEAEVNDSPNQGQERTFDDPDNKYEAYAAYYGLPYKGASREPARRKGGKNPPRAKTDKKNKNRSKGASPGPFAFNPYEIGTPVAAAKSCEEENDSNPCGSTTYYDSTGQGFLLPASPAEDEIPNQTPAPAPKRKKSPKRRTSQKKKKKNNQKNSPGYKIRGRKKNKRRPSKTELFPEEKKQKKTVKRAPSTPWKWQPLTDEEGEPYLWQEDQPFIRVVKVPKPPQAVRPPGGPPAFPPNNFVRHPPPPTRKSRP